jgi:hypothetical protein
MANTNKMKDVAKLLGLSIGEKFKIKGVEDKLYYLTPRGIYTKDDNNKHDIRVPSELIIDLLKDTSKVIKLPWCPSRVGEEYFIPILCSSSANLKTLYNSGLVCKSFEEAEALSCELIKHARFLKGFVD